MWSEMKNCDTEKFDLDNVFINFYLKASDGDNYCPNRFSVNFRAVDSIGQVSYSSGDIDRVLDNGDNGVLFRAKRQGKLIKAHANNVLGSSSI